MKTEKPKAPAATEPAGVQIVKIKLLTKTAYELPAPVDGRLHQDAEAGDVVETPIWSANELVRQGKAEIVT